MRVAWLQMAKSIGIDSKVLGEVEFGALRQHCAPPMRFEQAGIQYLNIAEKTQIELDQGFLGR